MRRIHYAWVILLLAFVGGPGGVLAGSMLMVAAGLILSYFGANIWMVYGLISLSHQLGSAVGAFGPGVLRDMTAGYQSSFLIGAGALVVATVLSLRVREHPHKDAAAAA